MRMNRREFVESASLSAVGAVLWPNQSLFAEINGERHPELARHKIVKAELNEIRYSWPRFVGKNAKKGPLGHGRKSQILKLYTDQGAQACGISNISVEALLPDIIGKKVSGLISPESGSVPGIDNHIDFALYDLMGIILDQPVYKLLGANGTRKTPVYSGMIYFDELGPKDEPLGIDNILKNCQWDYDYGYRQLKVKIGRSGKMYSHDKGLAKDIEVVRAIHEEFKCKGVDILVDSNDMYSYQDTLDFLTRVGDIPIFWVEEPFEENLKLGRDLRQWMDQNGFKNTYYGDGEGSSNFDTCMGMADEGILDVYQADLLRYGFTNWVKLMPQLKKKKTLASPHTFGDLMKTNCSAHLAAGFGNVITIEGVTCFCDEMDYGDYKIENGKLIVSDQPGFGMKLL